MKKNTTKLLSLILILSGFVINAQEFNVHQKHDIKVKNQNNLSILEDASLAFEAEVITFSAPPPASNPTPADGATDVIVFETETETGTANAIQLSWQGSDEATNYEINVGGTPTNLTYLGDFAGTVLTLTGIQEETTYYWQIIPKNSSGTASNNPVWSFTTADMNVSSAPLAAENPTPEDGAINVEITPVVNNDGDETQELNFSWELPDNSELAAQYIFKLGFDDEVDLFETNALQTNITITGIPYGEEIFWEVIPFNSQGEATGTVVWSFTTEELANEGAPLAVINPTPEDEAINVILNEEIDEDDNVILSLDFSWMLPEDSEPVAEYEFKLGLDENVDAFSTTLTGTSINLTGMQKGLTYFWQVIPSNSSGEAVNNEVWTFTTEEVPTDVVPLPAFNPTPADAATNVEIILEENPEGETLQSVLFEWEFDSESEFIAFTEFELSENEDMSEAFEISLIGDATSLNLSGMDYETTYYWRVTPTNSSGDAENNMIWSFSTEESLSNEAFERNDFIHFVSQNYLQIQSPKNIDQIEIYSINGKLLFQSEALKSNDAKIDLASYANGVYLSKITIEGVSESFKFVK